jgi:hypothetical protein
MPSAGTELRSPSALELSAFLSEKQASGMSYDDAWALAKKERAVPFDQMIRK